MQKRILILTLKIGGVITVARVLKDYFEKKGVKVKICFFEEVVSQRLYSILFKGWYLKPFPKKIRLWSFLYNNSGIYRVVYSLLYCISPKFTCPILREEIIKFNPDELIAGSFLPSFFIRHAIKDLPIRCNLNAVISNFDFPKYWDKYLDNYFIPHEGLLEVGVQSKIARDKIFISGLPINCDKITSGDLKTSILLVGGRLGIGIELDTILLVLNNFKGNLIVVCGENVKLNLLLNKIRHPKLKILGNIDSNIISELYNTSICVITKAGTLTLAEAAIRKVPIIINYFVEGHEKKNTEYLLKYDACFRGFNNNELLQSLKEIEGDSNICKIKVNNAYKLFNKSRNIDFSPVVERCGNVD